MLGATLGALAVAAAAGRVLVWIATAAVVAALYHPVVAALSRRVPRPLAVLVVVAVTLGAAGITVYRLVDDVVKETRRLQSSAPAAAARIERSGRFAEVARNFELSERTQRFVEEVPARLQGGSPAQAFRAAATRGVAFLATGVLSLFFLLFGPRLVGAAAAQVTDPVRRARYERIAVAAYHRAVCYIRGSILMAIAAGLLGFLAARLADVPGGAPLGLWMAMWDLVPLVGAGIGAVPIVVLAAVDDPGQGAVLAAVFAAYQLFEAFVLQRRVERTSIRVGPFLTIVGGLVGVKLYGLGGALLVMIWMTFVLAVLDEATRPAATGELVTP